MDCTAFVSGVGACFSHLTFQHSFAACLRDLSYVHMHGLIAGVCGANCGTYLL